MKFNALIKILFRQNLSALHFILYLDHVPSLKDDELEFFFHIQDDLRSDSGRHATNLGTPFPVMASHVVKGLHFLGDKESIDFAIANLVDLAAKGMANFFLEESINPFGRLHGDF